MKAKAKARIRVTVDRNTALQAIRTLDALGDALRLADADWPKSLKRTYKDTRLQLIEAVGYAALTSGLSELAAAD